MQYLVDLLSQHATTMPCKTAFTFVTDGDEEEDIISFSELDLYAREIAANLQTYKAEKKLFCCCFNQVLIISHHFLDAFMLDVYPCQPILQEITNTWKE